MEKKLVKIAVTGPESTGKSTLSEALAKEFGCNWVPEFARTFLKGRTPPYRESDLEKIAEGQWLREQNLIPEAEGLLIADTDMTVMKIWSEHAFGYCLPIIRKYWQLQHYDLYLLTDIDLPWEPDPLREHPHLREYFFNLYLEHLKDKGCRYFIVSGKNEERFESARREIVKLLRGD